MRSATDGRTTSRSSSVTVRSSSWIIVDGEEDVALIGVTMPDQDRRGECYAKEALGRLNELLPDGTTIHLEKDELDYREDDTFERRLRYVWIEQSGGGTTSSISFWFARGSRSLRSFRPTNGTRAI